MEKSSLYRDHHESSDAGPSASGSSATRTGHKESVDSADGEEQEEPSSSYGMNGGDNIDELESFREQWQEELKISSSRPEAHKGTGSSNIHGQSEETIEDRARILFLKGIQNEQDHKLYEAIQFYRRAIQLVPDIETRLYESSQAQSKDQSDELTSDLDNAAESESNANHNEIQDHEEDDEDGMLVRFQRLFSRDQTVCCPNQPQGGTHISALPMELILYIMRWVVSADLDLRALDLSCSTVCRGFYLAARDPEIWKLSCIRVWGVNCGGLSNFESWRQMYIERPRVHHHGCYISKTTYMRHGENSFQDQFYRPWHVVEYYRYLRFFPEGLVLMLTTPDEPVTSLRDLKQRNPQNQTVLSGHYRLRDDGITIVLKRQEDKSFGANNRTRNQRRKDVAQMSESSEQTFHLELQIISHRSRRHMQLVWQGYSVMRKSQGGSENITKFDVGSSRFPPFWFSRVKSYTTESEAVL